VYSWGEETSNWHGDITPVAITKITRQAMYVWRYIGARLCNHCCSGKAIGIERARGLRYHHAMRMRLPSSILPARLYNILPHLKRQIFEGKKVTAHFFLCKFFPETLVPCKNSASAPQKCILFLQCPLLLTNLKRNLNFLETFCKNTHVSSFMKIYSLGAPPPRDVPCGLTDRHGENTRHWMQFWKRV
jgi:hypothetical protein